MVLLVVGLILVFFIGSCPSVTTSKLVAYVLRRVGRSKLYDRGFDIAIPVELFGVRRKESEEINLRGKVQ